MAEVLIMLDTPDGKIGIVKSKIVAICKKEGSEHGINTELYVDRDSNPFNILDEFEQVAKKI
ncbi:hypothetical protein MNBD_GAMMA01-1319 [hydrothermal vent metagenome]|uniref:Uncharacterized protein n=1 Tax=hydrothermal vent metagenome TaxID=652676 RepID=A0A3B0VPW4_9ZZZZ